MDLENTMLSEISQSEKDNYHVLFTHTWNIMNKLSKWNRDTLIDRQQADRSGEGGGASRIEQKRKREKELLDTSNSVVGDCGKGRREVGAGGREYGRDKR